MRENDQMCNMQFGRPILLRIEKCSFDLARKLQDLSEIHLGEVDGVKARLE